MKTTEEQEREIRHNQEVIHNREVIVNNLSYIVESLVLAKAELFKAEKQGGYYFPYSIQLILDEQINRYQSELNQLLYYVKVYCTPAKEEKAEEL